MSNHITTVTDAVIASSDTSDDEITVRAEFLPEAPEISVRVDGTGVFYLSSAGARSLAQTLIERADDLDALIRHRERHNHP
ncbi:MAG: hypothetical protein JO147_10885 [Actinobacteria bacterium]|nr:hypothetical protein [Actinomycetota bacterium]